MVSNIYLSQLPSIKDLIIKHNITADKNLGQNFLTDFAITDLIISYLPNIDNATVVEVGPGLGTLTRSILAKNPKALHAIEFDKRFLFLIEQIQSIAGDKLTVHNADAMRFDFSALGRDLNVVSNLPYNIGTNLVLSWVRQPEQFADIIVMLQKEVVERICALPGDHNYSRLAILCALNYDAEMLFEVPADSFVPAPKVTSAVVMLRRKELFVTDDVYQKVAKVTEKLFQNRRKKVRSALLKMLSTEKLQELGLDLDKRPQDLTALDYIAIAQSL